MKKGDGLNVNFKEKTQYAGLDVWKLLMSYLVILIHCGLLENLLLSNDGKWGQLFRDISITSFFCANGFFGFKNLDLKKCLSDRKIFWTRWKKNVCKYFLWNIIYFPLMFYGEFFVYQSSAVKGLLKLSRTLFFSGWHFYSWTLWYMLALIISLAIIGICQKKIKCIYIFISAGCLYVVGIMIEQLSRSGNTIEIIQLYYQLFYTTRNAFFYALLFVSFGMLWSKKKSPKITFNFLYGIILIIFFGVFCFSHDNLLIERICAAGICCLLFIIILNISLPKSSLWRIMRGISICLYFVHMYYVAFFDLIIRKYVVMSNFEMFIGVAFCSSITAVVVQVCKAKYNWTWMEYLF